jgi:flagellar biosynthesis protein FlhG
MQIRRFRAAGMAQALRAARRALGPDAVILETRLLGADGPQAGEIEVLAATDHDPETAPRAGRGGHGPGAAVPPVVRAARPRSGPEDDRTLPRPRPRPRAGRNAREAGEREPRRGDSRAPLMAGGPLEAREQAGKPEGLQGSSPIGASGPGRERICLSVAVASGKGGVGKTNLVANLAVAMAEMGRAVLLLDGDLGLANVNLLLGLVPEHTLHDVVMGGLDLAEILLSGPAGISVLPASSGVERMADLDEYRREALLLAIEKASRDHDVLLIDTGPGIHRQNLRLAQAADEILVMTTPEPLAFASAYASLKALASRRLAHPPRLVVSMARDEAEALRVAHRLQRVARRFLGFAPELWGVVPADEAVPRAVHEQRPFVQSCPDSPAARAVRRLAERLLEAAARPVATPGAPHRAAA